jgi:hypothetical protein
VDWSVRNQTGYRASLPRAAHAIPRQNYGRLRQEASDLITPTAFQPTSTPAGSEPAPRPGYSGSCAWSVMVKEASATGAPVPGCPPPIERL